MSLVSNQMSQSWQNANTFDAMGDHVVASRLSCNSWPSPI